MVFLDQYDFFFFFFFFFLLCVTEILLYQQLLSQTWLSFSQLEFCMSYSLNYPNSGDEQYTYYTYSMHVSPFLSWFLSIDAKRWSCTHRVFRQCLGAWKQARCREWFRSLPGLLACWLIKVHSTLIKGHQKTHILTGASWTNLYNLSIAAGYIFEFVASIIISWITSKKIP